MVLIHQRIESDILKSILYFQTKWSKIVFFWYFYTMLREMHFMMQIYYFICNVWLEELLVIRFLSEMF